ncbi:hypothetical protein AALT_g12011 [Alternaria alternata]|nr:hypothetical protein AALT_g12011 [Alternaria alternata]
MTTKLPFAAARELFGSPKAILDFQNRANADPELAAQIDFFIACWKLSSKHKAPLDSLLNQDKKTKVRFDDNQPWDEKRRRLMSISSQNKQTKSTAQLNAYIAEADIVGKAFGEEKKGFFTKLSEPVRSCSTSLSHLEMLVAFSKGKHDDVEQNSSLEQPTQHPNAVSSGSKRASEHSVQPILKRQRLERTDGFAKPLQDDSMRQGHCTVGSSPLLRQEAYVPNETLPPNLPPTREELQRLQYFEKFAIPDTTDTQIVYRWGGRAALSTVTEGDPFNAEEKEWYWSSIVLDKLPFNFLKEFVKQSNTWKKENSKSSEKTRCVKLCLYKKPDDAYCYLYCIVPNAVVSECQGSHDMDFSSI